MANFVLDFPSVMSLVLMASDAVAAVGLDATGDEEAQARTSFALTMSIAHNPENQPACYSCQLTATRVHQYPQKEIKQEANTHLQ